MEREVEMEDNGHKGIKNMVEVFFYESVQDHSSCENIELEVADTLSDLIDELGKKLGDGFKEYLLADDNCFFLINGKSILRTGGLNTKLNPNDKVEVLPLVEAG